MVARPDPVKPGSMKDAHLLGTEILLAKPKRFVREMLRMPDGTEIDWYYSDVPESVMVVPVTPAGNVIFVRQYRHNLKLDTLELPAGVAKYGEDLQEAALRELKEETGYIADKRYQIQALGRFYALPSETNKWVNFFLVGTVAEKSPAIGDTEIEKYFDMSTVEMPIEEALLAVGDTIHGIETAGALMMASQRLAQMNAGTS